MALAATAEPGVKEDLGDAAAAVPTTGLFALDRLAPASVAPLDLKAPTDSMERPNVLTARRKHALRCGNKGRIHQNEELHRHSSLQIWEHATLKTRVSANKTRLHYSARQTRSLI